MASPIVRTDKDATTTFEPLSVASMPDSRIIVDHREFPVKSELMERHSRHYHKLLSYVAEAKDQYRVFKYDFSIPMQQLKAACCDWDDDFIGQASMNLDRSPRCKDLLKAFETILRAIHSQPYELSSTFDLEICIRLGYSYQALSILSLTMDTPFLNSDNLVGELPGKALYLLPFAATLRNKAFFKECLLHTLGPFKSPRFRQLNDPKLKLVAERAYNQMCATISEVQAELLAVTTGAGYNLFKETFSAEITAMMSKAAADSMVDGHFSLPKYFRTLHKYKGPGGPKIRRIVEPALKDNLVLRDEIRLPGEGVYADFLFCADITDEDLPWDCDQTVW